MKICKEDESLGSPQMGCCIATARQALNHTKETVTGRKRGRMRRILWHSQRISSISVWFSTKRKCYRLLLFFFLPRGGGMEQLICSEITPPSRHRGDKGGQSRGKYERRCWIAWKIRATMNKTAVKFMRNLLLGLTPKPTGSLMLWHLPQSLEDVVRKVQN